MARKTLFFVQPYVVRRHKLLASGALTFMDRHEALETGAAMARRRAGVVIMSQTYDAGQNLLMPPQVLQIFGNVPQEWTESRMAA